MDAKKKVDVKKDETKAAPADKPKQKKEIKVAIATTAQEDTEKVARNVFWPKAKPLQLDTVEQDDADAKPEAQGAADQSKNKDEPMEDDEAVELELPPRPKKKGKFHQEVQ